MDPSPPSPHAPASGIPAGTEPLLVRLPNALGDVILSQPTVVLLAGLGFRLTLIGPAFCRDLLHAAPAEIEVLPSSRAGFEALARIGARHALTLRSSFRSNRELRWAGVKTIGFLANWRSLFLWRAMRRPRGRHKSEEYYRLAQYASAVIRGARPGRDPEVNPPPPPPRLEPAPGAAEAAADLLRAAGVAPPFVVCCPTVSTRHPPVFKVWPHFPALYRRLEERGIATLTCPGPGEEERLSASAPRGAVLPGVPVRALAGVLARARWVLSNDTGPMHLAAALGVPTLGLFGDTTPVRYAPRGERAVTLGRLGRWPELDEVWERLGV